MDRNIRSRFPIEIGTYSLWLIKKYVIRRTDDVSIKSMYPLVLDPRYVDIRRCYVGAPFVFCREDLPLIDRHCCARHARLGAFVRDRLSLDRL